MRYPSLYVTFSVRSSVCRASYLRNGTLCDHSFWYTYVKWWYLHVFFLLLKNFVFLGCLGFHLEENIYLVVLFKSFASLLHSIKTLVSPSPRLPPPPPPPPPTHTHTHTSWASITPETKSWISTKALIQSNLIVIFVCCFESMWLH